MQEACLKGYDSKPPPAPSDFYIPPLEDRETLGFVYASSMLLAALIAGILIDHRGTHRTTTANCIIIDRFSAFGFELVALFLTLPLKNGWQWVKTARNLNLGVSRNRFCDFLADPDSRSFSRFGAIIMQLAVCALLYHSTVV